MGWQAIYRYKRSGGRPVTYFAYLTHNLHGWMGDVEDTKGFVLCCAAHRYREHTLLEYGNANSCTRVPLVIHKLPLS